jgi:hypothetical protein
MLEYHKKIDVFWNELVSSHAYKQQVPFVAKNFEHLDRNYYNHSHLLQSFNADVPEYQTFLKLLEVSVGSISWTCILPNVILPSHKDSFYMLRQEHNIDIDRCFRYLIFLEDWKFGQYVGFENKSITHWSAGDVWIFNSTEFHYGVNASNDPFHTCQISTFK